MRCCLFLWSLIPLILLGQAVSAAQPSLQAYQRRLEHFRGQIPALIRSADSFAAHAIEHPRALLNVAWRGQPSFSDELMSRAGGLAHAQPSQNREQFITREDVVLYSVRSWETHERLVRRELDAFRAQGWRVTLIASKAGMPDDIAVDFFIDNGAPDGGREHARVNLLANITLGWMWCGEYAAALSRRGKLPGILMTVAEGETADQHNNQFGLGEGQRTLIDCDTPIPAGRMADLYLQRVGRLVEDLNGEPTQTRIAQAADLIAQRMNAGRTVGLSGVNHLIFHEMYLDNRAPFKPIRPISRRAGDNPFARALKPGDLLVFIGYSGMNSRYHDFLTPIRAAQVELITSYVTAADPAMNAEGALVHIEQHWQLPDAELPLPGPPHRMAPVSGINAGLIHRMLDDAVYERLSRKE